MGRLIALAGPLGSGKTVIADRLAQALGGQRRSFGATVREIAAERGLPENRSTLQALGDTLIDEGWDVFCRRVVGTPTGEFTVVDGIRHVGAVDALRRRFSNSELVLVFVDAPYERRRDRICARDGIDSASFDAAASHRNESEVDAVRVLAEIVVENDGEDDGKLDRLVADIANEVVGR